ncbi:hypothetical protein [Kribbia dieselivorans]|uniref:hypothetical protein n=1 Tax=Kribbia dieselivorans TaxID=331526 RepID=UPI00083929B8|nr:hypothetical protein [Kribbia dieselivorans]
MAPSSHDPDTTVALPDLAERLLSEALNSAHGRAAELVVHDGPLRQTVLALTADSALADHNPPHAATLQVLTGRVRITWDGGERTVDQGQVGQIPKSRHGVTADEDSVFLLTTVTGVS